MNLIPSFFLLGSYEPGKKTVFQHSCQVYMAAAVKRVNEWHYQASTCFIEQEEINYILCILDVCVYNVNKKPKLNFLSVVDPIGNNKK